MMIMDDNEDLETQENELLALESIYDDCQFSRKHSKEGLRAGQLHINIEVPENFTIKVPRGRGPQQQGEDENAYESLELNYVPPVVLWFLLPLDYPSKSPPTFHLSCKWLDLVQLSKLCKHLDEIWEDHGPANEILFQWIQFLTSESLTVLDIQETCTINTSNFNASDVAHTDPNSVDARAKKPKTSLTQLIISLTEYDLQQRKDTFDKSFIDCNVCFEQKKGAQCIEFPVCGHVFCNGCMTEYFSIQIKDGAVHSLSCPSESCDYQATPSQVKELVSAELYEKYERFLLQSGLDCMSDIIYCPRLTCQLPVIIEKESTCAMCPTCRFAFCIFCKRSYHGLAPCPVTESELRELREKYLKAGPKEKEELEKKYGKERLKHAMENMISEKWLDDNAKKCPECGAHIQKTDGCNKMTCIKCRCYFCWLCGDILNRGNPYLHFNSPGASCFNRLFEGIDVENVIEIQDLEDEWLMF